MNIFNMNQLVSDFKEDRVGQREQVKYLFGWVMFAGLPRGDNFLTYIGVAMSFIYVWILYKENQSGDNKDFLSRFIAVDFIAICTITLYGFMGLLCFMPIVLILYFTGIYPIAVEFVNKFPGGTVPYAVGFVISMAIFVIKLFWVRGKIREIANN